MTLSYEAMTSLMRGILLGLSRWRVVGRENVPPTGPLIVVANHLHIADPPLLAASLPRRIVFMAKEELFAPPWGIFVRAYGAFPVRRGEADRNALRQGERTLGQGLALGMFPEGTRSPNHTLQRAHPGTALIAFRTRAPILPVGITGSERIRGIGSVLARPEITVNIGEPFSLPLPKGKVTARELADLADFIMERIADLIPPPYRGVYAREGRSQLRGTGASAQD